MGENIVDTGKFTLCRITCSKILVVITSFHSFSSIFSFDIEQVEQNKEPKGWRLGSRILNGSEKERTEKEKPPDGNPVK